MGDNKRLGAQTPNPPSHTPTTRSTTSEVFTNTQETRDSSSSLNNTTASTCEPCWPTNNNTVSNNNSMPDTLEETFEILVEGQSFSANLQALQDNSAYFKTMTKGRKYWSEERDGKVTLPALLPYQSSSSYHGLRTGLWSRICAQRVGFGRNSDAQSRQSLVERNLSLKHTSVQCWIRW